MKRILIFALLVLICTSISAQEKKNKEIKEALKALVAEKVDSLVAAKQLIFIARNATPAGGQDITLGALYDMIISGDTVAVDLPFFGRAYQVDYGNFDGGIKFIAPIQKYTVVFKKSCYTITFEAKGPSDSYRMNFYVFQSGFCTLSVNCNNRQSISFDGVLDNLGL